jgi:hypothetical protein
MNRLFPQRPAGALPDFELLLTLLDEWAQHERIVFPRSTNVQSSASGFRDTLIEHLAGYFCEQLNGWTQQSQAYAVRFVDAAFKADDRIVTFNWDLVLESAAMKSGFGVCYTESNMKCLGVAKPHGSLNLFERYNVNSTNHAQSAHGICTEVLKNAPPQYVAYRVKALASVANPTPNFHPMERVIVAPAAQKEYGSPWIQDQWKRAYHMLIKADEVIIIGFSLPPLDFRPRVLLQMAKAAKPELRIFLISPDAIRLAKCYQNRIGSTVDPIGCSWIDKLDCLVGRCNLTTSCSKHTNPSTATTP